MQVDEAQLSEQVHIGEAHVDARDFVGLSEDDSDRPRGCQWDESVCTAAPQFRIVVAPHCDWRDQSDLQLFCARHYATELARLVEVHLPACPQPASAHVTDFGALETTS